MKTKHILVIAGLDPTGGAGIIADLGVIHHFGLHAQGIVTAETVQSRQGVREIFPSDPAVLRRQLAAILEEREPDAVKIGMLATAPLVDAVTEAIKHIQRPVVLDPVIQASRQATRGLRLLTDDGFQTMKEKLIPNVTLITPNISEAEKLSELTIETPDAMERAAEVIFQRYKVAVLIKGGHLSEKGRDYLRHRDGRKRLSPGRKYTIDLHGSGCRLSSAIAVKLALGTDLTQAVTEAKEYLETVFAFEEGPARR